MTMGAHPYEGIGTTGYNNVTKKYETTWIDSMSTGMMKDVSVATLLNVAIFFSKFRSRLRNK